jgi:hypothetical protein
MGLPAQALREKAVPGRDNLRAGGVSLADIPALNSLALRSLVSLFDEKEQLFFKRVGLNRNGYRWDETSRKHTMVALLGLHRLAESGGAQPFDTASIEDVVFQNRSWVRSAGDLGLLTWFTAVCLPERLGVVFDEFDFEKALATYEDGRQARTVGLAWFLAGIAHAKLAGLETPPEVTDVAVDTYHMLTGNQSDDGIFGHAASTGFSRAALYNRLGTFSDQIYSIYALSVFARAFQIEEPLEPALACANSVCALQGELGQWWYLYDKRACRVVNRYPVFSLHQYGTAPCALLALGEATGRSFQKSIYKGLSWIAGANELAADLRSADRSFIWDSIGFKDHRARYWEAALSFLNIPERIRTKSLRIRYEARPDHFGWLLYAFGKFGLPSAVGAARAAATR